MIYRNRKLLTVAAAGVFSAGLLVTMVPAANAAAPSIAPAAVGVAAGASNGVIYPAPGTGWKYDFASQVVGGTGNEYAIQWEAVPGATKYVIVGNEGIYANGFIGNKYVTLGQFDAATTQATVTYVRTPTALRPAQSFFVVALSPDGQRQSLVKGYGSGKRT